MPYPADSIFDYPLLLKLFEAASKKPQELLIELSIDGDPDALFVPIANYESKILQFTTKQTEHGIALISDRDCKWEKLHGAIRSVWVYWQNRRIAWFRTTSSSQGIYLDGSSELTLPTKEFFVISNP